MGCVILAVGIALEVKADAALMVGEYLVRAIARRFHKDFGYVKLGFDTTLVILACVMSFCFIGGLHGVREGTVVAAVHAGWKSLAAGIIGKTIRVMRERAPESTGFVAWLAPRIGPEASEVGPDVREAMLAGLPEADRAFTQGEGDRLMCDLALLAKMALAAEGVSEDDIFDCGLSTYSHPRRFYSFRRDGEKSGRHAAMIWIKPEEA